jgi:hypothetical protein
MNSASYNEAITYFDKALHINSNYTTALNNKGFTLFFGEIQWHHWLF